MRRICDKKDCTGCGLCANLCPKECIEMISEDKLGHLFPEIDRDRCTDCGRCRKVCPSLNKEALTRPTTAYAAWARDGREYKSSSSGGAAAVISRHIINKGGVVYGCAMLPGVEVRHIRVDREEDLCLLKGSKYVQSDIQDALSLIKNDVKTGFPVLFVGTPCQVAAVKNLFPSTPDNLFLVDLVCHGVPSVGLLRKHINGIMPYQDCHSVIFREGNDFCLKVTSSVNGRDVTAYDCRLSTDRYRDFFINSFMDGYTYRDSCYRCLYARPERVGDITIGDFWGLGKDVPDHDNGCSLIMPVSAKGIELVEHIKPFLNIYERTVSEAVAGNDQLRAPKRKGPRIALYRALARHSDGSWPYYLTVADLRVRLRLKKTKKK